MFCEDGRVHNALWGIRRKKVTAQRYVEVAIVGDVVGSAHCSSKNSV